MGSLQIPASKRLMNLVKLTTEETSTLLQGHYLGPPEYTPMYRLAPESRDAIAVYASPVPQSFKKALPGCLELTRLLKLDGVTAYQTSEFLSATLRWLRTNTDAPCVFSYADPTATSSLTHRAHHGGIYVATGFTLLGKSTMTHKYRTPSGEIVSSPVCYRRFKTKSPEKILELNPDWELIRGVPKLLYVFPLRKRFNPIVGALPRYAAQKDSLNV